MWLDSTAFPNLLLDIVAACDAPTLLALRRVSCALRHAAERALAADLEVVVRRFALHGVSQFELELDPARPGSDADAVARVAAHVGAWVHGAREHIPSTVRFEPSAVGTLTVRGPLADAELRLPGAAPLAAALAALRPATLRLVDLLGPVTPAALPAARTAIAFLHLPTEWGQRVQATLGALAASGAPALVLHAAHHRPHRMPTPAAPPLPSPLPPAAHVTCILSPGSGERPLRPWRLVLVPGESYADYDDELADLVDAFAGAGDGQLTLVGAEDPEVAAMLARTAYLPHGGGRAAPLRLGRALPAGTLAGGPRGLDVHVRGLEDAGSVVGYLAQRVYDRRREREDAGVQPRRAEPVPGEPLPCPFAVLSRDEYEAQVGTRAFRLQMEEHLGELADGV